MNPTNQSPPHLSAAAIQNWLVEKLARRLGVAKEVVDPNKYFDEFGLDSTEALVLAGELEKWLGFEVQATALWYHPTIASLSEYITSAEEQRSTEATT